MDGTGEAKPGGSADGTGSWPWDSNERHNQGKQCTYNLFERSRANQWWQTIRCFPDFLSSLDSVCLVEASPQLREAQKAKLCGEDAVLVQSNNTYQCMMLELGIPVHWYEDLQMLPEAVVRQDSADRPANSAASTTPTVPFIVAHEFFDALPIHAFQSAAAPEPAPGNLTLPARPHSKKRQWRELLVSAAAPNRSLAMTGSSERQQAAQRPEFELTASRITTTHAQLLPNTNSRYSSILQIEGSTIEISPESISGMGKIARLIGGSTGVQASGRTATGCEARGAALIIDYGPAETVPSNSLRGIRGHTMVSPLSQPGMVDISADVDFVALADAALSASPDVEVHGPVEQAFFLESLGIRQRGESLETQALKTGGPEAQKRIRDGWERLISRSAATRDGGMGRIYKALAVVPVSRPTRRPLGFGGDVSA